MSIDGPMRYLDSGGQIVVVADVAGALGAVGEVSRVQVKCGDWDLMDGAQTGLGEVKRPAEVSGVEGEGVTDVGQAGGEESL